jgi:hypothetical protein
METSSAVQRTLATYRSDGVRLRGLAKTLARRLAKYMAPGEV